MQDEQQRSYFPVRSKLRRDGHRSAGEPEGPILRDSDTLLFVHHSNSSGQRKSQSDTASRANSSAACGLIPERPRSVDLYALSVALKNSPGTEVFVRHSASSSSSRNVFRRMT